MPASRSITRLTVKVAVSVLPKCSETTHAAIPSHKIFHSVIFPLEDVRQKVQDFCVQLTKIKIKIEDIKVKELKYCDLSSSLSVEISISKSSNFIVDQKIYYKPYIIETNTKSKTSN